MAAFHERLRSLLHRVTGQAPRAKPAISPSPGQPEHEPDADVDRQAAPERDEEALLDDVAPSGDQQAVHEDGADQWLDAEVGSESPVETASNRRPE